MAAEGKNLHGKSRIQIKWVDSCGTDANSTCIPPYWAEPRDLLALVCHKKGRLQPVKRHFFSWQGNEKSTNRPLIAIWVECRGERKEPTVYCAHGWWLTEHRSQSSHPLVSASTVWINYSWFMRGVIYNTACEGLFRRYNLTPTLHDNPNLEVGLTRFLLDCGNLHYLHP